MSQVVQDAQSRAVRTFWQGLLATVLISGLTALTEWLTAGDFTFRTLGVAAATAVTTAVLSYLQRAYVDPYRAISKGE